MRSEAIVNVTSQPENFTADDVSLTTLIIEELTREAIVNQEVRFLILMRVVILHHYCSIRFEIIT